MQLLIVDRTTWIWTLRLSLRIVKYSRNRIFNRGLQNKQQNPSFRLWIAEGRAGLYLCTQKLLRAKIQLFTVDSTTKIGTPNIHCGQQKKKGCIDSTTKSRATRFQCGQLNLEHDSSFSLWIAQPRAGLYVSNVHQIAQRGTGIQRFTVVNRNLNKTLVVHCGLQRRSRLQLVAIIEGAKTFEHFTVVLHNLTQGFSFLYG